MGKRPSFCREINCPFFSGNQGCVIKEWINEGWHGPKFNKKRREVESFYASKAMQDPDEVISICQRKA
jgi:hypothetical protein